MCLCASSMRNGKKLLLVVLNKIWLVWFTIAQRYIYITTNNSLYEVFRSHGLCNNSAVAIEWMDWRQAFQCILFYATDLFQYLLATNMNNKKQTPHKSMVHSTSSHPSHPLKLSWSITDTNNYVKFSNRRHTSEQSNKNKAVIIIMLFSCFSVSMHVVWTFIHKTPCDSSRSDILTFKKRPQWQLGV